MNASSSTVAQTSWWSRVPTFLKLWAGLQIAGIPILRLTDPAFEWSWSRAAAGLIIPFLLFVTMLRHSKGAWAIALAFSIFSFVFAVLWAIDPAHPADRVVGLWGVLYGAIELGILLSPQARAWVNQPTERKWTYTPKEKETLRAWSCRNCGDVFTSVAKQPVCPSCASEDLETATEPML